ncbi:hypothetical protein K439DRAFT_216291 [Ramaria rubella]|nr:hypothetical protein K439DRAFT_216291 [Ramaria rubella]
MPYISTQSLPTPPEDYDDPLGLIYPIAGLSLDLGFSSPTSWTPTVSPASYDPMSPSYDPCAASPCNPFPSSSPFATVTFARSRANSQLRVESAFTSHTAEQLPSTDSSSPSQPSLQASVLSRIPPPHSAPSLRRTKPCRFYLDPAGCKSGRWCNFKHPVGARPKNLESSPSTSNLDELRAAVVRSRAVNNALVSWDDAPDVRDIDPNWGKKDDSEVHPKFRTQPCRNFLLGLCRFADKCQFIHAPGLFPPIGSDGYPTSLPLPVDMPENVSPLGLAVPVSVWGAHPGIGVATEASAPEGVADAKPEQMSLFYRTKPCKYYENDGTCPHGAACKYIHDPKKFTLLSADPKPMPVIPASSWADDERELDFEDTPRFEGMDVDESETAMQDMTNEDLYQSTSMRRRERVRKVVTRDTRQPGGIFKPTWRVVGGGVMLSKSEKWSLRRVHADEDEDAVLDYQPCDWRTRGISPALPDDSPIDYAHAGSPFTADTLSALTPSDDFNSDYARFSVDPTFYPTDELLRAPSPDAMLQVTMGSFEGWNAAPAPRKKRVITGADLMRGIMVDEVRPGPATSHHKECSRSPSPRKEKERQKPRLTIAVPTPHLTHRRTQSYGVKGSAGYTPYPYPSQRIQKKVTVEARTDTGDDVLDWSVEDDEEDAGAVEYVAARKEDCGEDIRRVQSTPPTPRSSASYLYVPSMPKLPAESP